VTAIAKAFADGNRRVDVAAAAHREQNELGGIGTMVGQHVC